MPWFFSRSRFLALEERQEKLERDLRATTLEAADLYEKARTALGRAVKRANLSVEAPTDAGRPAAPPADDLPLHLRHLDPISRDIVRQRRTRVGPTNGAGT